MFYFHPQKLGKMIQFDEHIFQMGWFNHQRDVVRVFFVTSVDSRKRHDQGPNSIGWTSPKKAKPFEMVMEMEKIAVGFGGFDLERR